MARRVGADPARAVLEPIGGNGPQQLVTEFAGAIAAGDAEVALLLGSETGVHARGTSPMRDDKPDFTRDRRRLSSRTAATASSIHDDYTIAHGLTGAPVQYGLLDNARRARLGLSVADYRPRMAELFAPFTKVAAKNPFSSSPVERSVDELITVTDEQPDDLRSLPPAAAWPAIRSTRVRPCC